MKPQIILELEKELNCTFKSVQLNNIDWWESDKTFEYSVDVTGNITGFAIRNIGLVKIPRTISESTAHLNYLTSLNLSDNKISDITPLSGLRTLKILNLIGNNISDISSLKELNNIQDLNLNHNQIIDISPLRNLTNIVSLSLADNQISDISPLRDLQTFVVLVYVLFKLRILFL
ncbi:MAG: leucine-rich repeat domain-containing protein [Mariniphaga sp.]